MALRFDVPLSSPLMNNLHSHPKFHRFLPFLANHNPPPSPSLRLQRPIPGKNLFSYKNIVLFYHSTEKRKNLSTVKKNQTFWSDSESSPLFFSKCFFGCFPGHQDEFRRRVRINCSVAKTPEKNEVRKVGIGGKWDSSFG